MVKDMYVIGVEMFLKALKLQIISVKNQMKHKDLMYLIILFSIQYLNHQNQ